MSIPVHTPKTYKNVYDKNRIEYLQSRFDLSNDQSKAHLASSNELIELRSNLNNFPYSQWYRGNYRCENPIIARRLAGYAPLQHYYPIVTFEADELELYEPHNCYQYPYHTVKPITCNRCAACGQTHGKKCSFTREITHQP